MYSKQPVAIKKPPTAPVPMIANPTIKKTNKRKNYHAAEYAYQVKLAKRLKKFC